LSKDLIGSNQSNPLDGGLRDEHAIEGISVKKGQTEHGDGVQAGDGNLRVVVVQKLTPEQAWGDGEIRALEACLDRCLPGACGTEEELVLRVFDEGASGAR
jgi:hypothetical protein